LKTYAVKLSPESAFQSFPSSDTLFGAICWGIRRLYGNDKLQEILRRLDTDSPAFVLSSAYPLLENGGNVSVPCYPKPISAGLKTADIEDVAKDIKEKDIKSAMVDVITMYKKFKKTEYISESLLLDMINGIGERSLFERYHKEDINHVGSMLMTTKEHNSIWKDLNQLSFKISTVQKNSIDRLTMSTGGEGQTFYQPEISASEIFKLYFLIKTSDIDFLIPVFKYLEDRGIGGNRSTGKGSFKIECIGEKIFPDISKAHTFICLSRFIPSNKEIKWDSNNNYYEIFPYRSKVESEGEFKGEDVWKDKVMYVKEGSVLDAMMQKPFYGQCPVVKEIGGQKIRQNGITFPIFGNFGGLT